VSPVKYEVGLYIPEACIFHSHRRDLALTGWAPLWTRNVSPVRHELEFYIPEDTILHSPLRENLKSYIALAGWTV
jgi:hypothetical protein